MAEMGKKLIDLVGLGGQNIIMEISLEWVQEDLHLIGVFLQPGSYPWAGPFPLPGLGFPHLY